jgi:YD repeat-containing protein
MVVCQLTNGQPWGLAPWSTSKEGVRLNLAVMRGSGEFVWNKGSISGPGEAADQDINLNSGQTYRINGWTIQPEEHRTRFTYDASGHGMLINVPDVRTF